MIIHRDPFATPPTPTLVYGGTGIEGVRLRVQLVGLREVSRRSGVPFETLGDWCHGGYTSTELLTAVTRALAKLVAEPVRRCARDDCKRLARPRSAVCSTACRKAYGRRWSARRRVARARRRAERRGLPR